MKNWLLCVTTVCFSLVIVNFSSCQKPNDAIDNNQVIETPYTLYFGDTTGALYNTNDGITIKKVPFPADGVPFRAICTSKAILMIIKKNDRMYFSSNNGTNFNQSYDSVRVTPMLAANGFPIDLNQSMIIDIPRWDRVYIISGDPAPDNFMGIVYTFQNGIWGYWTKENYYNVDSVSIPIPLTITSMTFTKGNILFGWDAFNHKSLYRADTLNTTKFCETTPGVWWNPAGIPLPSTGFFSIGHYNNELIAIDNAGINGAYYSDDMGRDWTQFAGIPTNVPLLCVSSPFEEQCFIGSAGSGLYVLNANTHAFQPCNNGLGANLIVCGIAFKENIYKNSNTQKVVYIATNRGIYKSTDNGQNWLLVMPGNFTAIY